MKNKAGIVQRSCKTVEHYDLIYTVHLQTGERGVLTTQEYHAALCDLTPITGFADPMWAEAVGGRIQQEWRLQA